MTAHSVPIPTTFIDTNDLFTSIFLEAPTFELLQTVVTYTLTLDMMMNALRQGISTVASSTKNPEAQAMFKQCLEGVGEADALYRENKIQEAKRRIRAAQDIFKQAGKLRSKKASA